MARFIALLRGINVGGTGILPMKDLASLCGELGFSEVRTWIQSGNVIFESELKENAVQKRLESALAAKMRKKIDVMVRTPAEMAQVLQSNPFPDKEPAKVAVAFLSAALPADALKALAGPGGEQVRAGKCEIYIYYPDGMGKSKLKLPLGGAPATVRNVNTVAKLVAMSKEI